VLPKNLPKKEKPAHEKILTPLKEGVLGMIALKTKHQRSFKFLEICFLLFLRQKLVDTASKRSKMP